MLIEKMTGLLEQVAAAWEESNHTERFSSWTNVNSLYSSDGAPVLMGGYTIDNHQERSDLFGFLIFAQARRVAFLCDTVAHRAEEERWKSQQIALLPVALRVRELQDTLGGSIDLHTA
ncbi:Hypothetical protein D9617_19g101500 [Elsinoe fawcettii]|nr:Hypothetical protein D9617_19g101500 [Elsinoe fawcettii]